MARQRNDRCGRRHLRHAAKSWLLDRLALIAMTIVFACAIAVFAHEFWNVSAREVVLRLADMPSRQILAVAGLTALSHFLLTGYDSLALRYVRRQLGFRRK